MMVTDKTSEESLKEYILDMGEPLGRLFHTLWLDLANAYLIWNEYVVLFGTKQSRIDLMNEAAPRFFNIVQNSLLEGTILYITRLTERKKMRNYKQISIQLLPDMVKDESIIQKLEERIEIAKTNSGFCKDWRDRRIAHRDWNLAFDNNTTPLEKGSRKKISNALSSIADVLNLVQDAETMFDKLVGSRLGGAMSLLYIMDDGLKRKEERGQRIRIGRYQDNDIKPRDI